MSEFKIGAVCLFQDKFYSGVRVMLKRRLFEKLKDKLGDYLYGFDD